MTMQMTSHPIDMASSRAGPVLSRDRAIQWLVAIFTAVLVLSPLLPLVFQAFLNRPLYDAAAATTLKNFSDLASHPDFWQAIANTLVFGVMSSSIAVVIGLTAAILVGRTNLPGRSFFADMLLWPLYISGIVLAFGWITMYGPSGFITLWLEQILGFTPWQLYSMAGLSLVNGVSLAPLAFLYCISSTRMQDPALEEAARVCGATPLRILLTVNLPMMRPAIIFSLVMTFIVAIESLAIPLIMGSPVGMKFLTTFLYSHGLEGAAPNYGLVGAAACLLLALVSLLLLIQNKLLKRSERFVTLVGKATQPRLFDLGRIRWFAFGGMLLYLIAAIGPVIFGVTLRAFTVILSPYAPILDALTLENFRQIFAHATYIRSITNSILVAIVGGFLGTLFITLLTLVIQRSTFSGRTVLEHIALFPRAVPGLLVGIGAFYAVAYLPFLAPLRGTIWILVLVFTMRYIPSGYGTIAPTLMQIGSDIDRASRSVGADWWKTSWSILFPLLKPAMLACFALLFIRFLNEYSAAVFLFAPGTEVMGTTMLIFWAQGAVGPVASLAVLQIAITSIFVFLVRYIFRIRIYG